MAELLTFTNPQIRRVIMTLHLEPKELIKAGRLSEARKHLATAVKTAPADMGLRTLLFQVLAFCGEWDKAKKQLDVILDQDPGRETGVQVYLNLVHAEQERLGVATLKRRPSFYPQAPSYTEAYFAAWDKVVAQQFEEADKLFDQIQAQRPAVAGTLNGRSFSGFSDTDSFLSCFFEIIIQAHYVWVPIESLRELSIPLPKTLFDLIWLPTRVTTTDGLSVVGYVPVVYAQSFDHEDEQVKMGRVTDWVALGGPFARGCGQHVYDVGEEEVGILDIREMTFGTSP
jgi:type VI secretion system protein ImpE